MEQGTAVQSVLNDVLVGFMQKLEEVFGTQIQGLNGLMQETTTAMRQTSEQIGQLVTNLSSAGHEAGSAMSEQLQRAMENAEKKTGGNE